MPLNKDRRRVLSRARLLDQSIIPRAGRSKDRHPGRWTSRRRVLSTDLLRVQWITHLRAQSTFHRRGQSRPPLRDLWTGPRLARSKDRHPSPMTYREAMCSSGPMYIADHTAVTSVPAPAVPSGRTLRRQLSSDRNQRLQVLQQLGADDRVRDVAGWPSRSALGPARSRRRSARALPARRKAIGAGPRACIGITQLF